MQSTITVSTLGILFLVHVSEIILDSPNLSLSNKTRDYHMLKTKSSKYKKT
ncbi:hypothetical protein E1A91_A03G221500v1 [Gossypium mustelinum]|uniref:Uncharacterized protein n=1 Tax=Gossypium mustelinum TaxID=34275 RepID=A0A5D3A1B0_GOSMU|nr:hypothetical protein E1A91_A03G221500v1 [Gossypium mustelinum]